MGAPKLKQFKAKRSEGKKSPQQKDTTRDKAEIEQKQKAIHEMIKKDPRKAKILAEIISELLNEKV